VSFVLSIETFLAICDVHVGIVTAVLERQTLWCKGYSEFVHKHAEGLGWHEADAVCS
jgi:hypothetical protein